MLVFQAKPDSKSCTTFAGKISIESELGLILQKICVRVTFIGLCRFCTIQASPDGLDSIEALACETAGFSNWASQIESVKDRIQKLRTTCAFDTMCIQWGHHHHCHQTIT